MERILLTAPEEEDQMTQRDRGLLIVSVSGMRTWAAGLGSSRDVRFLSGKNGRVADLRHSWTICEWSRIQHWRGEINCRLFSGYGDAGEWMGVGHTSVYWDQLRASVLPHSIRLDDSYYICIRIPYSYCCDLHCTRRAL